MLSESALCRLRHHTWPGNVRELRSILIRVVFNSEKAELTAADIDREILGHGVSSEFDVFTRMRESGFKLKTRLHLIEKAFIEDALSETEGVQSRAAELLGVAPQTLGKHVRRLKISAGKGHSTSPSFGNGRNLRGKLVAAFDGNQIAIPTMLR